LVRECRKAGERVNCTVTVTNGGRNRKNINLCSSHLIDEFGNKSQRTRFNFAGAESICGDILEAGLPYIVRISADDLARDSKTLSIVFEDNLIARNVPIR